VSHKYSGEPAGASPGRERNYADRATCDPGRQQNPREGRVRGSVKQRRFVWPILISLSVPPGAFSAPADIAIARLRSKQTPIAPLKSVQVHRAESQIQRRRDLTFRGRGRLQRRVRWAILLAASGRRAPRP